MKNFCRGGGIACVAWMKVANILFFVLPFELFVEDW